ncbi:MAG: Zn-dependent alcohol dehydrogenase [Actinobacteria bacterium]|nr:Zn-dependent alcohol dehydrogenase [Actinomycetota bacterium]
MPKAAVLPALNEPMELLDLDLEAPKAGEVKVKMAASGVCHSDLSVQNGTILLPTPCVLGHEGAGVITEVGEGVTNVAPGDHVVLSFVPQCGTCFFCAREQGQLCEAANIALVSGGLLDGTPRFSRDGSPIFQMSACGTFSEETVVPAIGVVKIDPDMPLKQAALIGCGVLTGVGAALNTARIREGDTVAVVGCGGVGLNVIQGAKLAGAEQIIAVDMVEGKLELAQKFGATDTVNAGEGDAVSGVMSLTQQRGADLAFEVIGLKATIDQTINMTRRGGQAILVGVPNMEVMIELPAFLGLVVAEKSIKGCWYGSSNVGTDIPKLVSLYQDGKLMLDELISREIDNGQVNEAFDAMQKGEVARSVIVYD